MEVVRVVTLHLAGFGLCHPWLNYKAAGWHKPGQLVQQHPVLIRSHLILVSAHHFSSSAGA